MPDTPDRGTQVLLDADSIVIDEESQHIESELTPTMFPPLNNEPAQGIRAQIDLLYLWNPDVAQDLIEKLEEALASVEDGKIKPYEEVMSPIKQYTACTHGDNVYVANSDIEEKPEEFVETQWTLIATKKVPNDGVLTIQKNGVTVATFSANSAEDVVANIEADTQVQSDWAEADEESPAFILNKPVLGALAEKDTVEISEVNGLEVALSEKQDSLSEEQIQAIDSGITKELVEQIETNEGNISDIQEEMSKYGDVVTHNANEFQPAGDYATTGELNDLADIVDQETKDREKADEGLQDQIDNLAARGRFLALWNATTGLPTSTPQIDPYEYKTGDYYIVGTVGETNYRPSGTEYVIGQPSTEIETEELATDDVYYFDGAVWKLQINHGKTVSFANLAGQPEDNIALKQALENKQDTISDLGQIRSNASAGAGAATTIAGYGDVVTHNANEFQVAGDYATSTELSQGLAEKQDTISDLAAIRSNATAGKSASDTISGYGDIVTHNTNEFATSAQGIKADTAIQPNDNVSALTNDAGYITKDYHDASKQDQLTSANAGAGIAITNELGTNIFNKDNALLGYGIGSTGIIAPTTQYNCSNYVEVEPNTTYIRLSGETPVGNYYHLYDENKVWIERRSATSTGVMETSANTKYIAVAVDLGISLDTYQIVKGTSPVPYTPYENKTIISNTQTSAEWGNITGDITAQADLQDELDNKTTVIIRSW